MSTLSPIHGHVDWRGDWLVRQLPVGMTQDRFLVRFVTLIQQLAGGLLDHLDDMPHLTDVTVTPDPMVRYLGSWVGIDWIDPMLDQRVQREVVRRYCAELMWRGTRRGMQRLLALVTGDNDAVVTDSGGIFLHGEAPGAPPHVRMEVARLGPWATETDLLDIVRSELPASVTFDLIVGGRPVDQHVGGKR